MSFDDFVRWYMPHARKRFWTATIIIAVVVYGLVALLVFGVLGNSRRGVASQLWMSIWLWLAIFGPFSLIFLGVGLSMARQLRRLTWAMTAGGHEVLWVYGELQDTSLFTTASSIILAMHDGYKLRLTVPNHQYQHLLYAASLRFPYAISGWSHDNTQRYQYARHAHRARYR